MHVDIIPRGAEIKRRPVASRLLAGAPSTGFLLGDTLLIDVVLGRRRPAIPKEVLPLLGVCDLDRLAWRYSNRDRLGLGAFETVSYGEVAVA